MYVCFCQCKNVFEKKKEGKSSQSIIFLILVDRKVLDFGIYNK